MNKRTGERDGERILWEMHRQGWELKLSFMCAHNVACKSISVTHAHHSPPLCCEVCGDVFNRGATYSTEMLRVQLCISETDAAANIRGSASDDDLCVLTRRSSPVISVWHHRYILKWTMQSCTVCWRGDTCETALVLTGVRVEYKVFTVLHIHRVKIATSYIFYTVSLFCTYVYMLIIFTIDFIGYIFPFLLCTVYFYLTWGESHSHVYMCIVTVKGLFNFILCCQCFTAEQSVQQHPKVEKVSGVVYYSKSSNGLTKFLTAEAYGHVFTVAVIQQPWLIKGFYLLPVGVPQTFSATLRIYSTNNNYY